MEQLLEQFGRPVLVGIGQRGPARRLDAQMRQLAFAALKPALNLAQRMRTSQLTKQHGHQMTPAGKALGPLLSTGDLDQTLEVVARHELEHLAEHAA